MYSHLNLITPTELNTVEGPKGRFYITPEGNRYPSITTILGAGPKDWLIQWRESIGFEKADKEVARAAARGTAIHEMIEHHLNNMDSPTAGHRPEHITGFNQVRLVLKRINNIVTQESALWSDQLKCAGRVDCVGEFDGKLCIIDFKTSTNDKNISQVQDYYLQTTAYALMFEERYGIQINDLAIIMSVEKGAVPLVFKQPIDGYIEPLLKRINTYHTTYGNR